MTERYCLRKIEPGERGGYRGGGKVGKEKLQKQGEKDRLGLERNNWNVEK